MVDLHAPQPVSAFASLLLAPNPSAMTLDGTQSYAVRFPGHTSLIVVDPGPDDAGHVAALAALGDVALILITHRHPDHTAGIDALHQLTGAPVRAVLSEFCRPAAPPHPAHNTPAGFGEPLRDGELITEAGVSLRVVATPGHTSDSVSFFLPEDGQHGAMITGDTILGRGTTILDFPDGTLGDYLASLERLAGFGAATVLPAHGGTLPDLARIAGEYTAHRNQRLAQVRDAVERVESGHDDGSAASVAEVTDVVYADVDPAVRGAAEHSVSAQVAYLRGTEGA
ncbi:MBL fold metallo-hydrolase [Zhihengliuella flava]|uniref:Glyoxylase-like metal-dependent hydrolase (Beta-lactamase superfamily II) n=1 Tax=Zhihengliuella flava TaxID=1285193 RepID=A0A931D8B4_9MICC|nr:MBL fold metallo-hydrolase [Zhihengliuella flava]MBG6084277.1 glyoxylase-like metal-dependent hydrolase (beta-lactamase superfamily II) [Zhihengliuella flava]